MARYYRRRYWRAGKRRFKKSAVSTAVGRIFGGLLMLLVFDSLLDAIVPDLNESGSWFVDTVAFIDSIIPVFGIIVVAVPIYMLFKRSIF